MPPPLLRTPSKSPPLAHGSFGATHWWLLLLITVVGAVLRCWHLGAWSMWQDEAFSWRDATMPLTGDGGYWRSDSAAYPLAFLTIRGLLGLGVTTGSEGWLRLPFAIAGIVTVPLMALCGRRLVGAAAALLAAALLAIDPWHVFWSQNVRGYAFVVLAAVLAIDRGYAYAQHERVRDLIATVLAIAFGVLSHGTGWLLAVGLAGFLLSRFLPDRRSMRLRLCLLALASAIALPWLLRTFAVFGGFQASKGNPALMHFVQTTAYYFRPSLLLAAAAGLWVSSRTLDRPRALLLGCYSALPFLLLGIVGTELVKVTARYAICTLPALVWLAAFAGVELTKVLLRGLRGVRAAPLLCAVVPLLMVADFVEGTVLYHTVQYGQRARWREACEFVKARTQQAGARGMRVVSINQASVLYYLRPRHYMNDAVDPYPTTAVIALFGPTAMTGFSEGVKLHEPGAANHLEWHIRNAQNQGRYLCFLVTMPELVEQDPDGSLRRAIAEKCNLVQHLPCWVGPKDESIFLYEPKAP